MRHSNPVHIPKVAQGTQQAGFGLSLVPADGQRLFVGDLGRSFRCWGEKDALWSTRTHEKNKLVVV